MDKQRALVGVGVIGLALLLSSCAPESQQAASRAFDYAGRSAESLGKAAQEQAEAAATGVDRGLQKAERGINNTVRNIDEGLARAGQGVNDASIVTQVKTNLAADPFVRAARIDVDSRAGVVTLSGRVASEEARRRAIEDARAVQGVVDVVDRLTTPAGV